MGEEGKKEEEEEGYLIQRHKNSPFALPPLSEGKERDRPSRPRFTTGAPPPLSLSLSLSSPVASPLGLFCFWLGWARTSAVSLTDADSRAVGPTEMILL